MRANLYITDLAQLPPRYAAVDLVFDNGVSAGWQSTMCPRCGVRFREHTWALYMISPTGEAVSDCSEDPR